MVEEWLKPFKLDQDSINGADLRAMELLKLLKEDENLYIESGGALGSWEEDHDEGAKRGYRGEEWVRLMIADLDCAYYQPQIKENLPFDLYVKGLGTLEIKTSKPGEPHVDIKKAWDMRPSIFFLALKTCDKEMKTFQFMGWLYGHEVYKLEIMEDMPYKPCYRARFDELHGPKEFLDMLSKIRSPKGKKVASHGE